MAVATVKTLATKAAPFSSLSIAGLRESVDFPPFNSLEWLSIGTAHFQAIPGRGDYYNMN